MVYSSTFFLVFLAVFRPFLDGFAQVPDPQGYEESRWCDDCPGSVENDSKIREKRQVLFMCNLVEGGRVNSTVVEEVTTTVQEESSGGFQLCSAWRIARTLDRFSTAWLCGWDLFMQDGAPLLFANPVKQLLKEHFINNRVFSRHFPTAWPLRSLDLNLRDFWLWGYLKDVVFSASIAHLAELRPRIAQYILNMTPETLQSV
ncbi:uncharacterized protein TNCV_4327921 [Trichonephila clavipes]|nr:uncharacterized protein TNCV_4327921 [Trichonephila clavipes]